MRSHKFIGEPLFNSEEQTVYCGFKFDDDKIIGTWSYVLCRHPDSGLKFVMKIHSVFRDNNDSDDKFEGQMFRIEERTHNNNIRLSQTHILEEYNISIIEGGVTCLYVPPGVQDVDEWIHQHKNDVEHDGENSSQLLSDTDEDGHSEDSEDSEAADADRSQPIFFYTEDILGRDAVPPVLFDKYCAYNKTDNNNTIIDVHQELTQYIFHRYILPFVKNAFTRQQIEQLIVDYITDAKDNFAFSDEQKRCFSKVKSFIQNLADYIEKDDVYSVYNLCESALGLD